MEYKLRYASPAPDSAEGWEKYSMPIGNSHMGGNVFGGVDYERIQITENSAENDWGTGGLNSFADIFLRFPHTFEQAENYERGLGIGRALAYVGYDVDGIRVERESFATYPDRAVVGRVTTTKPLSFAVELQIPYLTEEEPRQKRGTVTVEGNTITMSGIMCYFHVRFGGQLRVFSDDTVTAEGGKLQVKDATNTYFVFCGATNYELRPEVFLEEDRQKKLRDFAPADLVNSITDKACASTYDELIARNVVGGQYDDTALSFADTDTMTYKITRADTSDGFSDGAYVTLNHSTELERQRYRFLVPQLNAVCGEAKAPEYLGE